MPHKLEDFLIAYRLLQRHGHYDGRRTGHLARSHTVNAIASAYAEESLGMMAVPEETISFIHYLGERRVWVRGMALRDGYVHARHFVSMPQPAEDHADDLFILLIESNSLRLTALGPVPIHRLTGRETPRSTQYYLQEIQATLNEEGNDDLFSLLQPDGH
jgi:hypothetical protein